jgi:hypothetical protein
MGDNTPTVPGGIPSTVFVPRDRLLLYRLLEAEREIVSADQEDILTVLEIIFKRMTYEEQRTIDPLVPKLGD